MVRKVCSNCIPGGAEVVSAGRGECEKCHAKDVPLYLVHTVEVLLGALSKLAKG